MVDQDPPLEQPLLARAHGGLHTVGLKRFGNNSGYASAD